MQQTATAVASQQYYHNPPGFVNIEDVYVTTSSSSTVKYVLRAVDSQKDWDELNAIQFTGSAIPQYFFQRRDDFGIWPTPQDSTGTIYVNYTYRDRNLSNADYTTGTVTVTNDSQTVTGSGTTFTAQMIGRWFQLTGQDGYWYRISNQSSTTAITLESAFQGTSGNTLNYRIAETPEIPEDGHELLVYGVTADILMGLKQDIAKGNGWNNMFWTGDFGNNSRDASNIRGGLIGLKKRYSSRSNSAIIRRGISRRRSQSKIWAQSIS